MKNRTDAEDQIYLMTLFMRGGLSTDTISVGYRIVPNTVDSSGGYFVLLRTAQASVSRPERVAFCPKTKETQRASMAVRVDLMLFIK